jgi:hypothetical protein
MKHTDERGRSAPAQSAAAKRMRSPSAAVLERKAERWAKEHPERSKWQRVKAASPGNLLDHWINKDRAPSVNKRTGRVYYPSHGPYDLGGPGLTEVERYGRQLKKAAKTAKAAAAQEKRLSAGRKEGLRDVAARRRSNARYDKWVQRFEGHGPIK